MTKSKKLALRVGVFASAFLLVTAAGLGATMAKYAKTSDTSATSHVAQFGVNLTWAGTPFAETYAQTDTSKTLPDSATNSVVSTQTVIAPGTSGSMTLQVDGSAEVAFTLNISLTEIYSADWKTSASGVEYHPVAISAVKQTYGTSDWNSAEDVTLTNNAVAEIVFAPGAVTRTLYTFTWTWAFDNSAVTAGYTVDTAIDYYKVTEVFDGYTVGTIISAEDYAYANIASTENQSKCTHVEYAANSTITVAQYEALDSSVTSNCTAITGDTADTHMSTVSTATYALGGTVTATQID